MAQTPTYIDSLAEHKNLKDEIASLRAEKDILKRDVQEYAQANTALIEAIHGHGIRDVSELRDKVLENILAKKRAEVKDLDVESNRMKDNNERELARSKKLASDNNEVSSNILEKKVSLEKITRMLEFETQRMNDFRINSEKEILGIEKSMGDAKIALADIDKKTSDYENEYSKKVAFIVNEDKKLSIKASDLNIYEARLREKCLELYPEMEIIL